MIFKLFWWMLLAGVWALLGTGSAAPMVALIASFTFTGHDHAAQQWMRSLNWRRVFWV